MNPVVALEQWTGECGHLAVIGGLVQNVRIRAHLIDRGEANMPA